MQTKNSKKITLRTLLADNRFILVCSFLLAVFFWAVVGITFSPEDTKTLHDVPVSIETKIPEQFGLKMFGENNMTIDFTARGKRYVVAKLGNDDFIVTVDTSSVSTANSYSLPIKVSKKNESADFTIEEYSQLTVNVYFDKEAERQESVKVVVPQGTEIAAQGYMLGENYILAEDKVEVSGPATEIARLRSVVANLTIEEPLKENKTFEEVPLSAVDANGAELKYIKINGKENATAKVTVPVYKRSTVPLRIDFSNKPDYYKGNPLEYKCSPEALGIAIIQNGTQTNDLKVGTVDFTSLSPEHNAFEFNISDLGSEVLPSTTQTKKIRAEVNLAGIVSRTVSLPAEKISINYPADAYSLSIRNITIADVVVCGQENEISSLDPDNLMCSIDLSEVDISSGVNRITVPLYLKDSQGTGSCWIYGTYNLIINAGEK